jgi:hypothetical protein
MAALQQLGGDVLLEHGLHELVVNIEAASSSFSRYSRPLLRVVGDLLSMISGRSPSK